MKSEIYSSNNRLISSAIVIFGCLFCCYLFQYRSIYNSIKISVKKTASIEYGSKNYKIDSLFDNIGGKIISIKKDINTSKIGKQEMVVVVKKDEVIKKISFKVLINDTTAPEIKLKSDKISLSLGDNYDILNNLEYVTDKIDGNINYQKSEFVNEDVDTNYYTVDGNVDTSIAGVYPIIIRAVDKYGNKSSIGYDVVVNPNNYNKVTTLSNNTNNNYISSFDTNNVVQLAYSLIGSPYVSGGSTPDGFDCSGFVQYLYKMAGISISRSSSTQINDGFGISYDQAQPGDILSWGYNDGIPTHSALYVGDGMMIHATNPRQGVIISNVDSWIKGSGTMILAVRRI